MQTSKLMAVAATTFFLVAACGPARVAQRRPSPTPVAPSPSELPTPSPDPSPTPTPTPVAPVAPPIPPAQPGPLPGQGLPVSADLPYPLLVQVENTLPARPQAGLGAASMVFEYLTEGGITRFSALYHRVPGVVGPVRSARFVSVYLYRRLGALLMASGGSKWTYNKIFADPGVPALINDFTPQFFFRWSGRLAPHNVYSTQADLLKAAHLGARNPRADDILRSDTWPGTTPAVAVSVPDLRSYFAYGGGTYSVATDGVTQHDVVYGDLRAQSVVVMHVRQWTVPYAEDVAGALARDFDLASGGAAEMYAHGTVVSGRWSTPGSAGITYTDGGGNPVGMPPGLVWVLLAN